MKSTDALTPGSAENGARGFPAVITAGLHLTGIYHGVCRGYKAVHQAEYLREFPRLQAMRAMAGSDRPDVAGPDKQLVAGNFGVGRVVAQRAQEQLGHAGDHGGNLS